MAVVAVLAEPRHQDPRKGWETERQPPDERLGCVPGKVHPDPFDGVLHHLQHRVAERETNNGDEDAEGNGPASAQGGVGLCIRGSFRGCFRRGHVHTLPDAYIGRRLNRLHGLARCGLTAVRAHEVAGSLGPGPTIRLRPCALAW